MKRTAKTGRKTGFSAKLAAGLSVWQYNAAATYGHSGHSEGGQFAALWGAVSFVMKNPVRSPGLSARELAEDTRRAMRRIVERMDKAIFESDEGFFRELAEYAKERKRFAQTGRPRSEADMLAAYFWEFCRGEDFVNIRSLWTERALLAQSGSPALVKAWKRKPFTPSVEETADFLSDVMEDPPDVRTVRRIMERLKGCPSRRTILEGELSRRIP